MRHKKTNRHRVNMDAALNYSRRAHDAAFGRSLVDMVYYMHLTLTYLYECGCGSALWPQGVREFAEFDVSADFTHAVLHVLRPELFPTDQR